LSSGGPAKFRKLCRHNFLSRDQFLRSGVILWIYSNTTIVTMLADHQFLFVKWPNHNNWSSMHWRRMVSHPGSSQYH